jgi:hypothetical protein
MSLVPEAQTVSVRKHSKTNVYSEIISTVKTKEQLGTTKIINFQHVAEKEEFISAVKLCKT